MEQQHEFGLSDREFLRASKIRVEIDYDIESNFEGIVELIRGADELNYTGTRLSSPEAIERFRTDLRAFACHAGCVRVADNYADYGLAGFYLMRQKPKDRRLIHFVFSCRVLNMGVEQYVYRLLGSPQLETALPFSRGEAAGPDWINASAGDRGLLRTGKLVLLGGCDLLQIASYCSADRLEFVNRAEENAKIRYDDFGFVLSNRAAVRDCAALRAIACWNYNDAIRFDAGLAEASLVILSLLEALNGRYYDAGGGVRFRLNKRLERPIRKPDPEWFDANFRDLELDFEGRLKLNAEALETIESRVPGDCEVFVLGGYTRGVSKKNLVRRRSLYNASVEAFCARHADRFRYVDLDALVPADGAIEPSHFTRETYFALARHILSRARSADDVPAAQAARARTAMEWSTSAARVRSS
jgi:hypothetical protein